MMPVKKLHISLEHQFYMKFHGEKGYFYIEANPNTMEEHGQFKLLCKIKPSISKVLSFLASGIFQLHPLGPGGVCSPSSAVWTSLIIVSIGLGRFPQENGSLSLKSGGWQGPGGRGPRPWLPRGWVAVPAS